MRDDFLTGEWASERHHLIATIRAGLRRLRDDHAWFHQRRFDAPWRDGQRADGLR